MRREPKRSMLSCFFFLSCSIAIECTNHTVLNEASRSRFFTNYVHASDTLLKGWFTYNGSAGTRMATTCVPADHCGTFVPGWLVGNHPSVDEGLVVRSVCLSKSQVCCMTSVSVLVRNCSGFFVYKLDVNSSISFTFRVCGGGIEGNVIFSDPFLSLRDCNENASSIVCYPLENHNHDISDTLFFAFFTNIKVIYSCLRYKMNSLSREGEGFIHFASLRRGMGVSYLDIRLLNPKACWYWI